MTIAATTTAATTGSTSSSAKAGASSNAASNGSSTTNPLVSLTSNFNDFLNLLLTQLKNQDPSTPMDANQFTSELVEFSGVEQQITTNGSLTQLIQATQGSEVIQATGVVGKQVTVTSPQIALQGGTAAVQFTTASAEPVAISVTNATGVDVRDASLTSASGANTWTWDGTDNSGAQLPDGAYTVTVTGTSAGATAALPFTIVGTATGVTNTSGSVDLQLGAVSVDFSKVVSVND